MNGAISRRTGPFRPGYGDFAGFWIGSCSGEARPLCRLPDGEVAVSWHLFADILPLAAATGGRIDVKRSIVLRSIKNQGRGASG